MAYTPGSRFNLILNIEEAYTPPSRYNTILNFADQTAGEDQEVYALGADSLAFGLAVIKNRNEKLFTAGWQSFRSGEATAWKYHSYATPAGLNATRYGVFTIITKNRYVRLGGYAAGAYGRPVVYNTLSIIRVTGINSFAAGQTSAMNLRRYVAPQGLNYSLFGGIKVENKICYLKTLGHSSLAFGTARIESLRAFIHPSGLNALKVGSNRISFNLQGAKIRQEKEHTLWGDKTFIAFALRHVEANSTVNMAKYGQAWIAYNPRYIAPRGLFEQFPSNHQIGMSRSVGMLGHDSARFGSRIIPENQSLYPQGFSTLFGGARIYNYVQRVYLKGFLTAGETYDHRWGRPELFNSTQYIAPFHYESDKTTGKWVYGDYSTKEPLQIFNRNRKVQTYGTLMQKFGYADVINKARVVHPVGIVSHIEANASKTMLAQAIRPFKIPGIEPPHLSNNHIVWLSGKRYNIPGARFDLFGSVHVENTRRIYRFISLGEQSLFGQAMISHAIRSVRIQSDYSIAAPVIPMPEVKLGVRYLEPRSIDSVRYGNIFVEERFTKIFPRWVLVDRVGEPQIRNKTPQLRARGISMDEYGLPYIGLYTRGLNVEGLNSQIFGRTTIADTKQTVDFLGYGIGKPELTKTHKIEIIGAGNHIPRRIQMRGIETENFDDGKVHKITQNVIRPESKLPMTEFGGTVVTANTIRVEPGYWEILMGTPSISNKNRRIFVSEFKDVFQPSKLSLSPHTIYAGIVNPPQQAIDNHVEPLLPLHPIDGLDAKGHLKETGVIFGTPDISHFKRTIYLHGSDMSKFGDFNPKLITLFIRPKGLNSFRMGMIAPIGSQYISFRKGLDSSVFGNVLVNHVEQKNRTIKLQGNDWLEFGKNEIQLLNRNIYPTGINSLQAGTKKDNDKPYMWQGLRIGAHIPTSVGGGDQSMFGLAWVSLRVRELKPIGLDYALVNVYDYSEFDLRMRVVRGISPDQKPTQQINPLGFNATMFNASNIKNRVHFIRPDGNSEQYRKGAF